MAGKFGGCCEIMKDVLESDEFEPLLAEDEDGIWWFLECNQGGQFGFVELETGQPISEAVALWLSQRKADRRVPQSHT